MLFLQVKNLVKRNGERLAVNNVSFEMMKHQKIAIAGETGSGKTSLLKMIGGLLQPDAGEILFEGKRIEGPLEKLIPGHDSIAYLSQHFELRNNYWVYELLEMANKLPEAEAATLFSLCQIEHLLHRRTNELSGGEKQRIVLAMQLIKKPKLLLLDEPFSNLDAIHEKTIKEVIHDVTEHFNTSCILVSHDGKDVLSWADMILVLKDGEVVQIGTPQQIYDLPNSFYCAGLFGNYNIISPGLKQLFHLTDINKITCVRPEKIQITPHGVTAVIKTIRYYGSYECIVVEINGEELELTEHLQNAQAGQKLSLSILEKDVFYC